jgi:hypothetical protein
LPRTTRCAQHSGRGRAPELTRVSAVRLFRVPTAPAPGNRSLRCDLHQGCSPVQMAPGRRSFGCRWRQLAFHAQPIGASARRHLLGVCCRRRNWGSTAREIVAGSGDGDGHRDVPDLWCGGRAAQAGGSSAPRLATRVLRCSPQALSSRLVGVTHLGRADAPRSATSPNVAATTPRTAGLRRESASFRGRLASGLRRVGRDCSKIPG